MMILETAKFRKGGDAQCSIPLFNRAFTVIGRDFWKEEEFQKNTEFYLEGLEYDLMELMPTYLDEARNEKVEQAESYLMYGLWEQAEYHLRNCGFSIRQTEWIIDSAKVAPFTLYFNCGCEVRTDIETRLPINCEHCCLPKMQNGGHWEENKRFSGRVCDACKEEWREVKEEGLIEL